MSSDWSLVEYRPGRYVKVTPSGDFLGRASRAEVREWFEAQREGGEPQTRPAKHDALDVLEDAFALFSPTGEETREAEPPEAEPDALGVLEQALSVFSPAGQRTPEPEPPAADPDAMGILEDVYSLVAPVAEDVQPEVSEELAGVELGSPDHRPLPLDQDPEEPQVEPRIQEAEPQLPALDDGGIQVLQRLESPADPADSGGEPQPPDLPGDVTEAEEPGESQATAPGLRQSEVPQLDPKAENIQAEEPELPQAVVSEPLEPEAPRTDPEVEKIQAEKPKEPQAAPPEPPEPEPPPLDLAGEAIETQDSPEPQEIEPEPIILDRQIEEHESELPRESPEAVPGPQSAGLDDLDFPDSPEIDELSSVSPESESEYLDPDPDDLGDPDDFLEEEVPASLSAKTSGPSHHLVTSDVGQAPTQKNHVLDGEALDNGVGRWLWVDPRHEVGYRPAGFDLAGFLGRAIDLFQSKAWTGGQRPGRLAVHPDEAGDDLQQAAEELGLEIVPNPQVSLGTYRLGLAELPADAKS